MKVIIVFNRRGVKLPDNLGNLVDPVGAPHETVFEMVENLEAICIASVKGEVVELKCDEDGNIAFTSEGAECEEVLRKVFGERIIDLTALTPGPLLSLFVTRWLCDEYLELLLDYSDSTYPLHVAAQRGTDVLIDLVDSVYHSYHVHSVLICSHIYGAAERTKKLKSNFKNWDMVTPGRSAIVRLVWITTFGLEGTLHLHEFSLLLDDLHKLMSGDLDILRFPWRYTGDFHKELREHRNCDRIQFVFDRLWNAAPASIEDPTVVR